MQHAGDVSGTRLSGLDGLRAVAVLLVVAFHFVPAAVPGGFLGVDMFFVISGFLITTLLLRERDARGIRLGRFWLRRARRLLPALVVVVLTTCTVAALIGGDVLVGIGPQLLGAATFSSNWVAVAQGEDYFAATAPQLLRNLWSLGVEEQYYLLWPVLLAIVCLIRRPRTRVLVVAGGAALSAVWMAVLYALAGADRAYFGTDGHAFGLLAGAALALALRTGTATAARVERWRRGPGQILAAALLGAVMAVALVLPGYTAAPFTGGLALVVIAMVPVLWAVTADGWLGRMLDRRPLRYVGERSYGIYLWHWPLLVLLEASVRDWRAAPAGAVLWTLLLAAATLAAADLSYRWVETPVRRLGFRGALASLLVRPRAVGAVAAAALLLAAGTTTAVAVAPSQTEAARVIAEGRAAVDGQSTSGGTGASDSPGTAAQNVGTVSQPEAAPLAAAPDPAPAGPAPAGPAPAEGAVPPGEDILAIGDSVMLASAPALQDAFPGILIDAAESRQMSEAADLLAAHAASGSLRPVIIVGLGTNGAAGWRSLEQVRALADGRRLVFVNAHGPMEWTGAVNQTLRDFVAQTPGATVADWDAVASEHGDVLASDGVHPTAGARSLYADCLREALRRT